MKNFFFGTTLVFFLLSQSILGQKKEYQRPTKSPIYGLVVTSGEKTGEVNLKWEINNSQNIDRIIIKRSSREISTYRLLQLAKTVNPKPLEANIYSYTDKNVPEGLHYYAVFSLKQIYFPEKAYFYPNENYIQTPILVYKDMSKKDKPKITANDINEEILKQFEPKLLTAINTENSVILSWVPPVLPQQQVSYEIYRSQRPLASKEAFLEARVLGETKSRLPLFEDKNPIYNEYVYYGVIVKEVSKKDYFAGLVKNSSYIRHKFKGTDLKEIVATRLKNSVIINWTPTNFSSKDTRIKYRVYRSLKKLDSAQNIRRARLLGTTPLDVFQFEDRKPLKNQKVFYGVVRLGSLLNHDFAGLEYGKSYIPFQFIQHPQNKKAKNYMSKLNYLLSKSYLKKNYQKCKFLLRKFLQIKDLSKKVKGKANLYLGLCHYRKKSYGQALKFFSNPYASKYYSKRAKFWFLQTVGKLNI